MNLFNEIITAIFQSRPNRFISFCIVGRKEIKVFVPNTGKLQELLIPGVKVLLTKSSETSSLQYRMVAVYKDDIPVMIDTHKSNAIARYLIESNQIRQFEGFTVVKEEITVGNSRFDLLLEKDRKKVFLEIKSCTLFDTWAQFPDAVTERGTKHIKELSIINKYYHGAEGAVLFLLHSGTAKSFIPNYHTDPIFAETLLSIKDKIAICPVSIRWNNDLTIGKTVDEIAIPWHIVKKETRDGGVYLLLMHLEKKTTITIGALGEMTFNPGYYIYTGSALKGLQARIDRHKRLTKKIRWHIDYLRAESKVTAVFPIRTSRDLECILAAKVKSISDWSVENFGCSDCNCKSHLFGFNENPLLKGAFHSMLLDARMNYNKVVIE
jgi:sugar fermentation stimulation protein A